MAGVRYTALARRDLIDIWVGIALDSPGAADRLFDRIEARVMGLGAFPELGSLRPDIAMAARVLVEAPYLILYRILSDGVQVVRVLHGARDIDRSLFEEGRE